MTVASMALSPTGIQLDCDRSELEALEILTGAVDSGVFVSENESGSICSPLYSPFSETSVDSGVGTVSLSEEDQLLAGLFGPDFPLLSKPQDSTLVSTTPLTQCSIEVPHTSAANPRMVATVSSSSSLPSSTESVPTDTLKRKRKMLADDDLARNRKNAEAARLNRLKKKKYLDDLEKDRERLKTSNVILKTKCTELQAKNRKLEDEVEYLQSVLANQSTLASLIQNIPGTPGIKLSSSFSCQKQSSTESESASPLPKRMRGCSDALSSRLSGGVCLHVSKENVSLEFCAQCSQKAAQV